MEKIRLQKYLSEVGYCSRRAAEEFIRARQVRINGEVATLGDKVSQEDVISVKGQVLEGKKRKRLVLAFNKPSGVESTLAPQEGRLTLLDFKFKQRVFPIGRLDRDSHGLLLLTNDGELCNKLAHPSFNHEKEYLVRVNKPLTPAILRTLGDGSLVIGKKNVRKAKVYRADDVTFGIILKEGRNRQIRKMCESLELEVIDLFRIRVENIHLGELPAGKFRVLSDVELRNLGK